jgi:glucose/arabinose dehydrogenase
MRAPVVLLLIAGLLSACSLLSGTPTQAPINPGPTLAPPQPTATTAPATAAPTRTPLPASPTALPPQETTAPPPTLTPEPTQPVVLQPGDFDPADYAFQEIASGFARPLLVTHAGDGSGRVFVVEQAGTIRILQADERLTAPFYDMTGEVSLGNEQGLLGLAFAPDYAESGTFYINFTDLNGDTHVERCMVSAADSNRADKESCHTVLFVEQPYPNHNGGHLAFGPDGYLYVGLGDGGSAGDPRGNGQNLRSLLGKLLRLDVSGDEAPYSVPTDNPFTSRDDALWEIWAWGLRNPWRFSFDRATGDLFIADVGQNAYEEVNFQPAGSPGGENYGWDYLEGLHPFEGRAPAGLTLVPPVAEYPQDVGGCSVTGGYVYRGPSLTELNGVYFYGDFCSGLLWTLVPAESGMQNALFANTDFNVSSFGEDEAGELYLTDLSGGAIYRLARAE